MNRACKLLGVLGLAGTAAACEPPGQSTQLIDGDPATQKIITHNGLAAINGLTASNGLVASNGLMTSNGLATSNGLMTSNGLATSNGLMTSNGGRKTVDYLVKCALGAGDSLKKRDQTGYEHTFYGSLGMAPGWKDGACDEACQEWMSACMIAHVNVSGVSVPIYITTDETKLPAVGCWEDGAPDRHEATWYGNIFTANPPVAMFDFGWDYQNVWPKPEGRVGASDATKPYDQGPGWCTGRTTSCGYAVGAEWWEPTECGAVGRAWTRVVASYVY